jgi:hypothetical protein
MFSRALWPRTADSSFQNKCKVCFGSGILHWRGGDLCERDLWASIWIPGCEPVCVSCKVFADLTMVVFFGNLASYLTANKKILCMCIYVALGFACCLLITWNDT